MSNVTPEELNTATEAVKKVSAQLVSDHSLHEGTRVRQEQIIRTQRRVWWIVAVVSTLVAAALVCIVWAVVLIRTTQVDGVKRGKTILSLVKDTNDSATILRCAVKVQNDDPTGTQDQHRIELNKCIAAAQKDKP